MRRGARGSGGSRLVVALYRYPIERLGTIWVAVTVARSRPWSSFTVLWTTTVVRPLWTGSASAVRVPRLTFRIRLAESWTVSGNCPGSQPPSAIVWAEARAVHASSARLLVAPA